MDAHKETIKNLLLFEHSKFITTKVIEYIGEDKAKLSALMDLFFADDWLLNQRAAWPMSYIAIEHPKLIAPYLEKLIDNLEQPSHNAVIRNTLRLFVELSIPESHEGKMYDLCYKLITQIKEPVANKIFAMSVMFTIARPYPELLNEIKLIIETQFPFEKPGFKSRGRKTLALIEKALIKS
jgi:hypothetical protein